MTGPETPTLDPEQILEAARALGPEIEAAADEIESGRCLPAPLLQSMRDAGIFRIAFPRDWGGPEMDILDQARLIEILAYHDASVAWVAMICSDSGHYAARLDERIARSLYPTMDLLTSGLLYPVGRARRVDGGLRVTGRWQFGSGCLHADQIVGGCLVVDDDTPIIGADGLPEITVVWLPRDEVAIEDTWYTTGLAGSGSNDYSATDVFVPDGHHFNPFRVGTRTEPLYRYHGFFFANLPGVALGCAQRMIDDFVAVARTKLSMPAMTPLKDEYRVQLVVAESTAKVAAARLYQDDVLTRLWARVQGGDQPTRAERAALGIMMVHVVQTAREVAEAITEAVGAEAIYHRSPFERRRRDLATVAAHVVGQRKSMARLAGLLFDEDPPFLYV